MRTSDSACASPSGSAGRGGRSALPAARTAVACSIHCAQARQAGRSARGCAVELQGGDAAGDAAQRRVHGQRRLQPLRRSAAVPATRGAGSPPGCCWRCRRRAGRGPPRPAPPRRAGPRPRRAHRRRGRRPRSPARAGPAPAPTPATAAAPPAPRGRSPAPHRAPRMAAISSSLCPGAPSSESRTTSGVMTIMNSAETRRPQREGKHGERKQRHRHGERRGAEGGEPGRDQPAHQRAADALQRAGEGQRDIGLQGHDQHDGQPVPVRGRPVAA